MTKPFKLSIKHQRLVLPAAPELLQAFPHAQRMDVSGILGPTPCIVLPHDEDNTKVARHFGFDVPTPVATYYNWNHGKPFGAQVSTVEMLTMEKRAYVLNGMGTGKTKAALWAFDWLLRRMQVRKMIVLAPLSTLHNTWAKEAFATVPHLKVNVLHGSKAKRVKLLADKSADIYVINHDGVETVFAELRARTDIDVWVLDELALYRNGASTRHRTLSKLLVTRPRVWGMTGGPMPAAPTDVYGQARLVTPWTVTMSFSNFRESVMRKVSTFKWVPRQTAIPDAFQVMQPSVRFTLDDVVELPDVVLQTVNVQMGTNQARVYKELKSKMHTMFTEGKVTAVNAGVLQSKLMQVALGWVYTSDKAIVALDNTAALADLLDRIESTDRKVIVFVPFTHALNGVSEYLTAHNHPNDVVDGSVSKSVRDDVFGRFQQDDVSRLIVAHPQCMAHGLTLTAADTIIWFGPHPSLEIFDQANARIRRVGQKHKQQVFMFSRTPEERECYRRLQARQTTQSLLLDMFSAQTQEGLAA